MEKYRVLLFALALVGCGVTQEEKLQISEGAEVASSEAEIINGYIDYGHPSVGLVYPSGCTGTLIGRRTVITAAHCVTSQVQPGSFCSNGFCSNGTYLRHPEYTTNGYFNDIAVLRLDSDFQALSGIIPSRLASSAPSVGWQVTLVGFGCTSWDTKAGYGTKRYGYNTLDDVDPLQIQWDGSDARICPGDSGGAVFRGADCQIGVLSHRQDFLNGNDDVATRVDAVDSWVLRISGDFSIFTCGTMCGNGICEAGEHNLNCPSDCASVCGNYLCESDELGMCGVDCLVCGDGICGNAGDEDCEADCGVCGNDICEIGDPYGCRDCM